MKEIPFFLMVSDIPHLSVDFDRPRGGYIIRKDALDVLFLVPFGVVLNCEEKEVRSYLNMRFSLLKRRHHDDDQIQFRCPCCGSWLWSFVATYKKNDGVIYCDSCTEETEQWRSGPGTGECKACSASADFSHWKDEKPVMTYVHLYMR